MPTPWWKKPLRVLQTNLQVKDTPGMDARRIASQVRQLDANALVSNVGGIYAWYKSRVPYHHINEYLPPERDLLRELIDACHGEGLSFIARFDFSKTDDTTYQAKPAWFVRDTQGRPKIVGKERFGDWSLLLSTCINAGYRNAQFAVPVLEEVLDSYAIDGIFFNAPHYEVCHCQACQRKYQELYHEALPEDSALFRPEWPGDCLRDNIGLLRAAVKAKRPDLPVILYYNLYKDNLNDRTATADMICTEPQDVLSLGWRDIPQSWKPALAVRMGTTAEDTPAPFGIIHSCPGMDWRHTGLPVAEYRYWLAQVPANGGQIWHSVTGYPDTITDKRILECVGEVNASIAKVEALMEGAVSTAKAVLLWNAKPSAEGLAEGLLAEHVQFDLMDTYQVTAARLAGYDLAILPAEYPLTPQIEGVLRAYVQGGGRLLAESCEPGFIDRMGDLFGVEEASVGSERLHAAYIRLEGDRLRGSRFGRVDLLPMRGHMAYVTPRQGTRVLATLVPPFAPPDAVGAPPERASLPTPTTDLPLAVQGGEGRTLLLPFPLSGLIREYRLAEHSALLGQCVGTLLGETQVEVENASGVQAMLFKRGQDMLLHLVNGTGQRPLRDSVRLSRVRFSLALPSAESYRIESVIAQESVETSVRDGRLCGVLSSLDAWDMLRICPV